MEKISSKSLYYPPGGLLIWIIIFLELFTFGIALIVMVVQGNQEPDIFHNSRMMLNPVYGAINTLFLITSGFFMALAMRYYKLGEKIKTLWYFKLTIAGGMCFLLLKSIEYYEKIEAGIGLGFNTFFSFYWMLTLFHVIHVIVGMVILLVVSRSIKKNRDNTNVEDVEASAAFWHMCDLIWLLLFPIIYLSF